MRCSVPFCKTTQDNISVEGITYHSFPTDQHLHTAWLRALGIHERHPPESRPAVCSLHFLNEDIYKGKNGVLQLNASAVPAAVQICIICLDTDSKMFSVKKHDLEIAYRNLTGYKLQMSERGNFRPTLCGECMHRLNNFSKFRDKSLRAYSAIVELINKHEFITMHQTKMINRDSMKSNMIKTVFEPDCCDLYIYQWPDKEQHTTYRQVELDNSVYDVAETIREEQTNEMRADESHKEATMEVRNENKDVEEHSNDEVSFEETVEEDSNLLDYTTLLFQATSPVEPSSKELESVKVENDISDCHDSTDMDDENMTTNIKQENDHDIHKTQDPLTLLTSAESYTSNSSLTTEHKYDSQMKDNSISDYPQSSFSPMTTEQLSRGPENVHPNKDVEEEVVEKTERAFENSTYKSNHNTANVLTKDSRRSCTYSCKINCLLKRHMKTHTREKPFSCTLCDYKGTRENFLANHIRTAHSTSRKTWSCKFCDFKCNNKTVLTRHTKVHTNEKQVSCNVCNYTCTLKKDLKRHMIITHPDEKPFICDLCGYKCARKDNLYYHIKLHMDDKPFTCAFCDYKCAHKASLIDHVVIHTGEKPFSCELCDFKCARKSSLASHKMIHSSEKPFSCELCDFKCARKSSLASHKIIHAGEKPFSCELCDFKCARKSSLASHKMNHASEKPFSCELCDFKCAQKRSLDSHRVVHTSEKPFSCELCDFKCARKSSLASHRISHASEKPFACTQCEYKTARKADLRSHVRVHAIDKPLSCTLCKYSCVHKSQLVSHMRSHKRSFSCVICKKMFGRKHYLKIHMKIHSGKSLCDKRFHCKFCDFICELKSILYDHYKTIHTNEKPFACELCDFKCAQKRFLVCHKIIHSVEKPFCCTQCEYKSARKIDLRRHVRKHATDKPFSCTLCKFRCVDKSQLAIHMKSHTGQTHYCDLCPYKSVYKNSLRRHIVNLHMQRK